jgi:hypothetical protein
MGESRGKWGGSRIENPRGTLTQRSPLAKNALGKQREEDRGHREEGEEGKVVRGLELRVRGGTAKAAASRPSSELGAGRTPIVMKIF